MRKIRQIAILCLLATAPIVAQDRPITIRAGTLPDGRGGVQRNAGMA
jgi:hypothetical protein